jgi:elongation factor P
MINVTDLRPGTTFKQNGQIFIVLKYEHNKVGRGGATIRVRVKNLETGSITEKSYQSGARVEPLEVQQREAHYLYRSGGKLAFMNIRNYEQFEIDPDIIGDQEKFLQEGAVVKVLFMLGDREKPVSVELAPKMIFTVSEADPGVKGDTAANMFKQVKLENGLIIKAPLFIKTGQKVVVDTRTGEYVERSK